jgi:hypothetical protein
MERKIPTYKIIVTPDDAETGVFAVSLVDQPAIEVDWVKLAKVEDIFFSASKDKQMLFGPLLIPGKLIYRRDESGNEYNIVFDEEVIQIIADKFNENKLGDVFNFQHSDKKVEATLLQNWITGDKDKSQDYGFCLPKGTWFGGVKVKDEQFWLNEVKTDKVKGFSVEISAGTKLIEMTSTEDKNKINLMEYKTRDGLTLTWEGDAAVGKEVFLVLEDGTKVPANNGDYELEDGTKVVIANGKVAEIIAAEEPAAAEDMAEPAAAAPAATIDINAVMDAVKPMIEEFRGIIAELSSRLDALENIEPTMASDEALTRVKELEATIENLSKIAGAPSISKKNDIELKRDANETEITSKVEWIKSYR